MTNGTEVANSKDSIQNPFDKVILVNVSIGMMGDKKQLSTDKIEVEADKELVQATKTIINCPEYKALQDFRSSVTTYMRSKAPPGTGRLFKGGIYPIPISIISEVLDELDALVGDFFILVDKLLEVYDIRVQENLERLDKVANASDYLPKDMVKSKFRMTRLTMSIGPSSNLKGFDEELYKKEGEKIKKDCLEASEVMQLAMRSMFQEYLDHLIKSLTPGEDGKKKKFYESGVVKLTTFLAEFKDKNITNDEELAELVQKCRNVMEGKDPKDLRKDDDVRSLVKDALAKIKAPIDKMIGSVTSRKITMED